VNKPLVVIYAAVVLDAIGTGLIFPILPRLLQSVTGVSDIALYVGAIYSLFAVMQFIFMPVLGSLSDRFGRRPVMLIALGGASIDYVLLSFAPELWMLAVGRAIAGLTSANMAIATAYITDITPEEQRARRFGLFHAMFGLGFIIGPVLGGFLGDIWLRAPFVAAAVLNSLNFFLALFLLPESHQGERGTKFAFANLNPLKPIGWAFSMRGLVPLIAIFFVFNFVGQMYGSCWALWGYDAFHWNGLWVGLSLGFFGLLHALAQAFLPGPVVKRLGERNAVFFGLTFEAIALVISALATQGWVIFAAMPGYALGGVGIPALQSLATQQAAADKQGQLQGVLASIVSLASIFGPLFFSTAYFVVQDIRPGIIWLIGVGIYVLAIPLIWGIRSTRRAENTA